MLKVGITGGIGSGKSTVCQLFSLLDIPVFNADTEAKKLMQDDPALVKELKDEFGERIFADGRLDRAALAAIVFKDPVRLERLNSLVHPAVFKAYDHWIAQQHSCPYVLKEAALMYESGSDKGNDYTIFVAAPEDLRISRVMKRDNASRESVLERIGRQMPEEEKQARADFIIYNDEEQLVIPQVLKLHEFLISKSV